MAKRGEEHVPRFFRYDLGIGKKLIKRRVVSESGANIKATVHFIVIFGWINTLSVLLCPISNDVRFSFYLIFL